MIILITFTLPPLYTQNHFTFPLPPLCRSVLHTGTASKTAVSPAAGWIHNTAGSQHPKTQHCRSPQFSVWKAGSHSQGLHRLTTTHVSLEHSSSLKGKWFVNVLTQCCQRLVFGHTSQQLSRSPAATHSSFVYFYVNTGGTPKQRATTAWGSACQ